MKIRMNLSSKFIFSITVLIIIIICLVIFTTLKKERSMILGQMQRKGFVLTEVLAMASVNSFLNYDYSTLKRYMDTVVKDEDVISVMILDKDGRVKMHSDIDLIGTTVDDSITIKALRADEPVFQTDRINKIKDIYYFSVPIIAEDQKLGLIRIAMSNENVTLKIKESGNRLLIIGLIAIVIGVLGAVFMAGMISKPLRRLAQGAEAVSKGDLNWKVNIKSKDEIGILADAFSYMTKALRKYIESLVKTEKLAVLGELASGIMHEVRNPLEPIKGSAEYLQKKYKTDKVVEKYTRIIKDEINEVSRFLDEFLEFAKPPDPNFISLDIKSVINETLALTDYYIRGHKMEIIKNIEDDLPPIMADSAQLKQMFMNLILNSVQAQREKERLLKISSYLKNKEGYIVVEFFDYGHGIQEEKIERIFDPFFTTKENSTGLGLAICHGIVERHNGKIEAESEPGKWTLIKISLPVYDEKNE